MKNDVHGIKQLSEYIKTDEDRDFIRIPINYEIFPKIKAFRDKIEEIDDIFGSDDFKSKYFTSKGIKNHKYTKLIRMCEKSENYIEKPAKLNKNGEKYEKVDMFKIEYITGKLNYEYKNDERTFSTQVIHNIDGVKTNMKYSTVSELVKLIPYKSKVRYVVQLFKLGEMKSKDDYKNFKYNANMKILLIEVKPFFNESKLNITFGDLIDDSDDEDTIENKSDDEDESEDSDDE